MLRSAMIVAAGTGERMRSEIPKQFLRIAGKPVLAHTLDRFRSFDPGIKLVVVLAESHQHLWESLVAEYPRYAGLEVITGGETRFHSVRNGLQRIGDNETVGIHDAVRPLVSPETLERCYSGAEANGSAIPVIAPRESVRMVTGKGNHFLDRESVRLVQTPQVFSAHLLKQSYDVPHDPVFTDDASVFEATHGKVHLVDGNQENIKLTFPGDLLYAGNILKEQKREQ